MTPNHRQGHVEPFPTAGGRHVPGGRPAPAVPVFLDEANALLAGAGYHGPVDQAARVEIHHRMVTIVAAARNGPWQPSPARVVEHPPARASRWPVLWFMSLGLCITAATVGVVIPDCEVIGIVGCITALVVGGAGLARQVQP